MIESPPKYMEIALSEAAAAADRGEVPVGAGLVAPDGSIVAQAGNRVEEKHDITAHAEIECIRQATAAIGDTRLPGYRLYVTLEPCSMCATAISFARISDLYYGADDPKGGGVRHGPRIFNQPTCHHAPEVYSGIDDVRAGALLKDFFAARR